MILDEEIDSGLIRPSEEVNPSILLNCAFVMEVLMESTSKVIKPSFGF